MATSLRSQILFLHTEKKTPKQIRNHFSMLDGDGQPRCSLEEIEACIIDGTSSPAQSAPSQIHETTRREISFRSITSMRTSPASRAAQDPSPTPSSPGLLHQVAPALDEPSALRRTLTDVQEQMAQLRALTARLQLATDAAHARAEVATATAEAAVALARSSRSPSPTPLSPGRSSPLPPTPGPPLTQRPTFYSAPASPLRDPPQTAELVELLASSIAQLAKIGRAHV
mgnify:FL=1